jgi:hypothetical protein
MDHPAQYTFWLLWIVLVLIRRRLPEFPSWERPGQTAEPYNHNMTE